MELERSECRWCLTNIRHFFRSRKNIRLFVEYSIDHLRPLIFIRYRKMKKPTFVLLIWCLFVISKVAYITTGVLVKVQMEAIAACDIEKILSHLTRLQRTQQCLRVDSDDRSLDIRHQICRGSFKTSLAGLPSRCWGHQGKILAHFFLGMDTQRLFRHWCPRWDLPSATLHLQGVEWGEVYRLAQPPRPSLWRPQRRQFCFS